MNEVNNEQAQKIEQAFAEDIHSSVFETLPMKERDYWQAVQWLQQRKTALRTLDALHLAACKGAGLLLVTADQSFAQAADMLGIDCQILVAQS